MMTQISYWSQTHMWQWWLLSLSLTNYASLFCSSQCVSKRCWVSGRQRHSIPWLVRPKVRKRCVGLFEWTKKHSPLGIRKKKGGGRRKKSADPRERRGATEERDRGSPNQPTCCQPLLPCMHGASCLWGSRGLSDTWSWEGGEHCMWRGKLEGFFLCV